MPLMTLTTAADPFVGWMLLQSLWPLVAGAAFGAAVLTVGAGFIGAWVEAKREHRRWLRERRYEAYTRVFALIQGFSLNAGKFEKIATRKVSIRSRTFLPRSNKRQVRQLRADPEIQALDAHADRLFNSVADVLAPVLLLGPERVTRHAVRMQTAYEGGDKEAQHEAERAFLVAAQKLLRIDRSS